MGKRFNIPIFYRSPIISLIKSARRDSDARKKNLSPSKLDLGPVRFKIARHFGFCFGVENAIDIAYRALEENPGKKVFLLSEMIHNPHVNQDLCQRGVRFLRATNGEQLIPFSELNAGDIVIVPAFGTTVESFEKLESLGINTQRYNATCPFVEKVWKRAAELGKRGFTIIIHGKAAHEETRATFSHARLNSPSLVIRDMQEAELLAAYIRGERSIEECRKDFAGRFSNDFDIESHLQRIGVVNQTTMLATETHAISEVLRQAITTRFGSDFFADTRDTLCYATTENQDAVRGLISSGGDLALVVGGYNSSNTSHLVELCQEVMPTFYIKDADEILDRRCIRHLDLHKSTIKTSSDWLPDLQRPIDILITAGASCPDILVDQVIEKVSGYFEHTLPIEQALASFKQGLLAELHTP